MNIIDRQWNDEPEQNGKGLIEQGKQRFEEKIILENGNINKQSTVCPERKAQKTNTSAKTKTTQKTPGRSETNEGKMVGYKLELYNQVILNSSNVDYPEQWNILM